MSLVTPADWPNVSPQASFVRVAASAQSTPDHPQHDRKPGHTSVLFAAAPFVLYICYFPPSVSVSVRVPSLGPMTQQCVRLPPILPVATSDQIRSGSALAQAGPSRPRPQILSRAPGGTCPWSSATGHRPRTRARPLESSLCSSASHSGLRLGPPEPRPRVSLRVLRSVSSAGSGPHSQFMRGGDAKSDRCSALPVAASDQPGVRIRIRESENLNQRIRESAQIIRDS